MLNKGDRHWKLLDIKKNKAMAVAGGNNPNYTNYFIVPYIFETYCNNFSLKF